MHPTAHLSFPAPSPTLSIAYKFLTPFHWPPHINSQYTQKPLKLISFQIHRENQITKESTFHFHSRNFLPFLLKSLFIINQNHRQIPTFHFPSSIRQLI